MTGAELPKDATTTRENSTDALMPLDVMLKAMRARVDKGELDAAASIAKDIAPYMHAKLASVQHTGRGGGPIPALDLPNISDEQLAALEAIFGPLAGSGTDDTGDPGGEGEAAG